MLQDTRTVTLLKLLFVLNTISLLVFYPLSSYWHLKNLREIDTHTGGSVSTSFRNKDPSFLGKVRTVLTLP